VFGVTRRLRDAAGEWTLSTRTALSAGAGFGLTLAYKRAKFKYRGGRYVQLSGSEYET